MENPVLLQTDLSCTVPKTSCRNRAFLDIFFAAQHSASSLPLINRVPRSPQVAWDQPPDADVSFLSSPSTAALFLLAGPT